MSHLPSIVALCGGTCAGKTTIARRFGEQLRSVGISSSYLAQDWYYKDLSYLPVPERAQTNFDHPSAIDIDLFKSDISDLSKGAPIMAPYYDQVTYERVDGATPVTVEAIIIVDGLFLLSCDSLRRLYSIKVYVEANDIDRKSRRLARDVMKYGYATSRIEENWQRVLLPMHRQFVASQQVHADFTINSSTDRDVGKSVETLVRKLGRTVY